MNKNSIRTGFLALLVVTFFALPVHLQQNQAGVSLNEIVPEETMLYVSIPDVAETKDQLQNTPLLKIWNEPEVQNFAAEIKSQAPNVRKRMDRMVQQITNRNLQETLNVIDGQVSLAVYPSSTNAGPPISGALAIDAVSPSDLQEIIQNVSDHLEQRPGLERRTVEYNSHDLHIFSPGTSGGPGPGGPGQSGRPAGPIPGIAATYTGNTLLLTPGEQPMKQLLDRHNNQDTTSLVDRETYQEAQGSSGNGSIFHTFMDVQGALELMNPRQMGPRAKSVLNITGLNDTQYIAMRSNIQDGQFLDSLSIRTDGEPSKIMDLLEFDPVDPALLEQVPADPQALTTASYDFQEKWNTLKELISEVSPDSFSLEANLNQFEERVGLHPEEDIFATLGSQFVGYSHYPERGGILPDSIIIMELEQPERLEELMNALANTFPENANFEGEFQWREMSYRDQTIHYPWITGMDSRDFSDVPMDDPQEAFRELFGANSTASTLNGQLFFYRNGNGHLVLSDNAHSLKRHIHRNSGDMPSVAETEELGEQSMSRLEQGLYNYARSDRLIESLYNSTLSFSPMIQSLLSTAGIDVDLSKLPLGETIGQHLKPTETVISYSDTGIHVETRSNTGMVTMIGGGALIGGAAGYAFSRMMPFGPGPGGPGRRPGGVPPGERGGDDSSGSDSDTSEDTGLGLGPSRPGQPNDFIESVFQAQERYYFAGLSDSEENRYAPSIAALYSASQQNSIVNDLLSEELAQADRGTHGEDAEPHNGYYVRMVEQLPDGSSLAANLDETWAAVFEPAEDSDAQFTYLLTSRGRVFRKMMQGGRLEQMPENPIANGWVPHQ